IFAAAALGTVAILVFGAWFNWQINDLWPNAPRWLRFFELVPFLWIFCFAEEAVLGPVPRGRARPVRFAVFLGMRGAIWLAFVLAYFGLSSGQIILPILVLQFTALSVA